jgi:hypothetical protein
MARPLPSFCLHRIKSSGTAAARPPPIRAKEEAGGDGKMKGDEKAETANKKAGSDDAGAVGRKVMVASDGGSEEARTALQWALSHAVRPCDTVVLLDVVRGGGGGSKNHRT